MGQAASLPRRALRDAGPQALAQDIVATARPALIFVRRTHDDDALPAGTSKMGGFPDLPAGMDWPSRLPVRGSRERARAMRQERERQRRQAAPRDAGDVDEEILRYLPEEQREELRRSLEASRPDPARLVAAWASEDRYDEMKIETFDRSFPLAFLSQLDLQRLSIEAGFDLALPHQGLLSLFEDITSDDIDGSIHA